MVARSEYTRHFREDFDRSRDFVVRKPFTASGKNHVSGPDPIDKTLFTVRRLRQLYDQRYLDMSSMNGVKHEPDVRAAVKEARLLNARLAESLPKVVQNVLETPPPTRRVVRRRASTPAVPITRRRLNV